MKNKNNDGQFKIKICKEDCEWFDSLFEEKKEIPKNDGATNKGLVPSFAPKKPKPKGV